MLYDLTNNRGFDAAHNRIDSLRLLGQTIEIEVYKHTRSSAQNRALHTLFKQIADILNNAGATMEGIARLEIPYTESIIKELWWKGTQKIMFDTNSTTKLTTEQINSIFDVLSLHLANTIGESVDFPSYESLIKKVR